MLLLQLTYKERAFNYTINLPDSFCNYLYNAILSLLHLKEGIHMTTATFDDFLKLDIRVGQIIQAEPFEKARRPAYKLWVDFGDKVGIKKTSAQITDCYTIEELNGMQVLAVINFEPKQIADFMSEVLVLGIYSEQGVVLIQPGKSARNGDRLG